MARIRRTTGQIIVRLGAVELRLAPGKGEGKGCKRMGVIEKTNYHWRKEQGGLCTFPNPGPATHHAAP